MNQLIALSPSELVPAQQQLTAWCDSRVTHWMAEKAEAQSCYDHAIAHKWKAEPFKRLVAKAERRIGFYTKLKSAVEHGYLLIPNFPMEVFAIRTKAETPRGSARYRHSSELIQKAQTLPEGHGDYKNPTPLLTSSTFKEGEREVTEWYPIEFQDEMEIPLHLVKPEIMQAVDRAQALRLFDEIGVSTDRRADPIVCGRIRFKEGYSTKQATFFIAWFVDLDRL